MTKCKWGECPNEGTNQRYKLATEERTGKEIQMKGRFLHGIQVCDNHLKEAEKEYPYNDSENIP